MQTLRAKGRVKLNRRSPVYAGGIFEAEDKDAVLLKKLGLAEDAEAPKSPADLPPAAMKRAPKKEEAEKPAPLAPTYQRRDMHAAGQTGEETPAPSSHRGRRQRVFGSTAFEEDE